ncbi:MAG: hypothetical protein AAF614_07085 [Chloroflexota bacterium]
MIRAIIWDVGGVLWRLENLATHRQWEACLELAEGELVDAVFDSPI